MKNLLPSSKYPTTWPSRRLLAGALGALAVFVLSVFFLFTGSDVSCEELTDRLEGPRIRCSFKVATNPQAVWAAFTLTEEPQPHYFDAILQAEMHSGGRWRFLTDDRKRLLAGGEVLAVEPPLRFEQTFLAADLDDPPSRIAVSIEEVPGGSQVTLVHDGFMHHTTTYRRFRRAHPLALSALKSLLESGELPIRARLYTMLFKPGMKTFTVRAEPWD